VCFTFSFAAMSMERPPCCLPELGKPSPTSCDTLVLLPSASTGLPPCFGKNSDRPSDEEHEVVFLPACRHSAGSSVKCTYIEVPQVEYTLSVVLSKPRWLWGCEMGANERGVVGGNEAVWTRAEGELGLESRLLGMDILRLVIERAHTAREAVRICAELLEAHGQGGGCAEGDANWTYENGFLFADPTEAFVVETAGISWWAAESVPLGSCRNISNGISIRSDVFAMHAGLKAHCLDRRWWDGREPFDFKAVLTGRVTTAALEPSGREAAGRTMLTGLAGDVESGLVSTKSELARRMARILRDECSGICFRDLHGFNSTGSQISLLAGGTDDMASAETSDLSMHLFTCASDPCLAAYKLFSFQSATGVAECHAGTQSLELWRAHRACVLRGGATPDLSGIEMRAFAGVDAGSSDSLAHVLAEELKLFSDC